MSSSSSLTPAQTASRYRFSGYAPPLVELDGVGPAYFVVGVHPYYINQPTFWAKPVYVFSPVRSSGGVIYPSAVQDQTFGSSRIIPQLTTLSSQSSQSIVEKNTAVKSNKSNNSSKLFKMKPLR